MTPFLVPIVSMLAEKGLNLLSNAVDKGSDKAIELISEKTGIDLTSKQELSTEDMRVLKQFEKEHELELLRLRFESTKEDNRSRETFYSEAHKTYREKNQQADEISSHIIKYNLPIIAILVIVNVLIVYYMQDNATLIAIVSNIIGVAIANLFSERNTIVNFFFGSSIGSKEKDMK